jgi:Protein of unknown function (DUF742)
VGRLGPGGDRTSHEPTPHEPTSYEPTPHEPTPHEPTSYEPDSGDPADVAPAPDLADERTYAVRPYALTGGRTRSGRRTQLPVEALVQAVDRPDLAGLTPEERRILRLTDGQFLSVAELSASLEVPVGVVRVLVGDLEASGRARVHGPASLDSTPATSLSVLESVLDGICAL